MPVAVVTGGGRGIGRGIVLELARGGYHVVVNYRHRPEDADEACRLAREAGAPDALAVRADVAVPDDGADLIRRALDRFGAIDLWVNNAGVAPEVRLDLLETTPESWDRVLGINLRGPFFLTQRVARAMIDRGGAGEPGHRPTIIFITSISSAFASPSRPEYCVSKAGLSMVARLFAARLAEHGIAVYEVRPGLIETEMTAGVHDRYTGLLQGGIAPIRRWGTPADVGRAVALLAAGHLPYSTGDVIHVDGGMHLPRL